LKKSVYIWADADSTIGYGHFVRSLALTDMIKEHFDCTFFTQTPTEYQKREVLKICKLIELPSEDKKFEMFFQHLTGDEIVVLDNYFFISEYQKEIKQIGCKLICIGTNDKHYYADVVINYVLNESDFSAESYTKFCLGLDWLLVRKPFLNATKRKTDILSIKNVVICFGGTDQFELTEKAISALNDLSDIFDIHVISTDIIGDLRINNMLRQNIKMHINASAEEIAVIFSQCDIAILSASSVAQEALACNIPVIAGYYINNQKNFYNYLFENNYILGVGNMMNEDFPATLLSTIDYLISNGFDTKRIDIKGTKNNYIRLLSAL